VSPFDLILIEYYTLFVCYSWHFDIIFKAAVGKNFLEGFKTDFGVDKSFVTFILYIYYIGIANDNTICIRTIIYLYII